MIPLYQPNVAFLRETLASISNAVGHESMQIALVQDQPRMPNDPALSALIEECKDRGIEVHEPIGPLGIGRNWNRCIDLARGEVVHILHQDDRLRPGFYEAHEVPLKASARIGASFTQHAFITMDGKLLHDGHLQRDQAGLLDDWYEYLVANLAVQCPSIVVRRSVYEALGGFDTSYRFCLDRAMWQRIAASFPVWFEPRPLAEYRVHDGSESARLAASFTPWREVRRCVDEGLEVVAPSARTMVERSAHFHMSRLAWNQLRRAIDRRFWRLAFTEFVGFLSVTRPTDYYRVIARTFPRAPFVREETLEAVEPPRRRKRIVLLTEFFPGDPQKSVFGVFLRLRSLIAGLGEVGELDVVFFWPPGRDATAAEERVWSERIHALWPISGTIRFVRFGRRAGKLNLLTDAFWTLRGAVGFMEPWPSMRTTARGSVALLSGVLQQLQPDLIVAHRLGTGAALLRIGRPLPPVIVDIDDLEDVKLTRLARSLPAGRKRVAKYAWAALARYATTRVARIADRLVVTSEFDRNKLQAMCPATPVITVPNSGSALTETQIAHATPPTLLFVGTFAYPPNTEGMTWLIETVWPMIHEAMPEARLLVVGDGNENLGAVTAEGVDVLGFVEDLRPLYEKAHLTVCPILRGAGTRIKIIEAALNGRPTVSTSLGAEGLTFADGSEIAIADDPAAFAQACLALLRDTDYANRLGQAARQRALATHDPKQVAKVVAEMCRNLLASVPEFRRGPPVSPLP